MTTRTTAKEFNSKIVSMAVVCHLLAKFILDYKDSYKRQPRSSCRNADNMDFVIPDEMS